MSSRISAGSASVARLRPVGPSSAWTTSQPRRLEQEAGEVAVLFVVFDQQDAPVHAYASFSAPLGRSGRVTVKVLPSCQRLSTVIVAPHHFRQAAADRQTEAGSIMLAR